MGSAAIALAISLTSSAMATTPTVVTFEDLNTATDYSIYQCGLGCGKLPSPITPSTPKYSQAYTNENAVYAGITWDNTWYFYNQTYSGDVYVPHSGKERLFKYNNSTGPMANSYFWFPTAVKFDGA